ncbi:cytochrome P450 [Fodinicola acaciae]|uniref:cytochrome P450 n=1 Tax=Fodinicola acaciae TaxID=2681555 RepID=UPI0013CF8723|nr:cytochrome P450 [Fodinicola acaciae]
MSTVQIASSDLDPFSDEFLAEPYEPHRHLRDAGPVVWLEKYGLWAMARYAEVRAALSDAETYCSSAGVGISDFRREKPWRVPSLLLEADPPEHTRARAVISKALSPATVRGLRDNFRATADKLVDEVVAAGELDAIADFATRFALTAFADAVGLPAAERENLHSYGNMVFNTFGPRNHLFEEAVAGAGPVREWIDAHCQPDLLAPDGLGMRIHRIAAEHGLSTSDSALLLRSFLSAGVDTTVHSLGNAIFCFAENPAEWDALRAEPALARTALDEVIRYESPVQTFFRTTTREVDAGGVRVPAGAKVLLFLGSANRDPRHWDAPDRFSVRRRVAGHVGFGFGIHACVGAVMARLEGEIVLASMAERIGRIEPAGKPRRLLNNTLRGRTHLPVRVVV